MKRFLTALFLGNGKPTSKTHFIWNSVAGVINALQSTFILFVLMRISDTETSGLFTLTFATANLMLCIGKYGVRYFQVSDVNSQYSFSTYWVHRICLDLLMALASALFCVFSFYFSGYSSEKAWTCFVMCCFKLIDAFEDVYFGDYQKQGRLDVAGRCMSLRLCVSIIFFLVGFVVTQNIITATVISIVFSISFLICFTRFNSSTFGKPSWQEADTKAVLRLMIVCFPVFFGSFILLFIINMPKYAIDRYLSDEAQAIYGFVSMPVFVVSLLSEFFFRPLVSPMSVDWNHDNIKSFRLSIIKITLTILCITIVCIAGGVIVGIPILSILYNYDLYPYRIVLLLLLSGGGVLSLTSFLTMVLTIIRAQKALTIPYLLTVFSAFLVSNDLVQKKELTGAALAYFISMGILCICITFIVVYKIRKKEKRI